jgi:hypothetical protein
MLKLSPPSKYYESCVRAPLANCGFTGVEGRTAADGRVDYRLHVPCACSLVGESQPHVFRSGHHREGFPQAGRLACCLASASESTVALQTARGIYGGHRVTPHTPITPRVRVHFYRVLRVGSESSAVAFRAWWTSVWWISAEPPSGGRAPRSDPAMSPSSTSTRPGRIRWASPRSKGTHSMPTSCSAVRTSTSSSP